MRSRGETASKRMTLIVPCKLLNLKRISDVNLHLPLAIKLPGSIHKGPDRPIPVQFQFPVFN